ncbi:MAG: TolC family protein [Phycisphaerae bacterium]
MHRQMMTMRMKVGSALVLLAIGGFAGLGCEERTSQVKTAGADGTITGAKDSSLDSAGILERVAIDQTLHAATTGSAAPVGPLSGLVSFSSKEVGRYVPDPMDVGLKDISRSRTEKVSLQECVLRALANNFKIKTDGYGPAISATDILSAEASFDAVYFLDASYQKLDDPTGNASVSGKSDTRGMASGLRKLLPTGATLTGTYNLLRTKSATQALATPNSNPAFTNNFAVELRQPILRNFGLDVNRSGIATARNNQRISKYKYRETVRDSLLEVEKAYWKLVQARRSVVIQQMLVEQTKETLGALEKRKDYDVYAIQMTRVQSLLGTRQAEYVQVKNAVKDAEDQLKALMNDPELNLGEDIEIIPTDFPTLGPLVLDRIGEVRVALECRSEVQEAKLQINNQRINVAVAKNQALPRFDMVFRYTINGLSDNPGDTFDQMSTSNFQDYFVGLSFEYPIGNRGPRAALKKAELQRDQAIAGLKQVIENVILEVDVAVRNLQTSYYQVTPSSQAVQASEENLAAIVLRKVKLSPEFLEVQLNAQETLANARRGLLAALVNYNTSIVQLERAKDTLLRYNNVNIEAHP